MAKFRKKPVVIEAVQFTGKNVLEVMTFIMGHPPTLGSDMAHEKWDDYCRIAERDGIHIKTLEDGPKSQVSHWAMPGDWVIKGVQGEFYPCKPDIFAATYEPEEPRQ